MKKLTILSIIFFALMFASFAGASDFRFEVPVYLNKVCPKITKLAVLCDVAKDSNFNNRIGYASRKYPISAISSNSKVNYLFVVSFDAESGKNPSDAKWYRCVLDVYFEDGSLAVFQKGTMASKGCPIDESQPLTEQVRGQIK